MGVDTHKDAHVAVAKDHLGRHLGDTTISTTPGGYRDLLRWAQVHGEVEAWGIEGTGSYGAGLSRFLRGADQAVIEINRPDRKARRLKGKSDLVDAEAAARAVLSGEAIAVPKSGDNRVEMVRALRTARSSAVKARTQAVNALKALVVNAPAELREQLRGLSTTHLVRQCARLRPGDIVGPLAATKLAMRSLACRHEALAAEIKILDPELARLTTETAPALVAIFGVGTEVAGTLLVTAGDNPERLRSEAAFAHLCGVSPIDASSGKTVRHRLNRGGDRQANPRSTGSCSSACVTTPGPRSTPSVAPAKASRRPRSSDASSDTWPGRSSQCCQISVRKTWLRQLDIYRSIKGQEVVERRFGGFKGPLAVAPIFLKNNRRIEALLSVICLALLIFCLVERQVRHAIAPEVTMTGFPGRPKARPTGRLIFQALGRLPLIPASATGPPVIPAPPALAARILELLGVDPITTR